MGDTLYPSKLAQQYVNTDNEAVLRQLMSTPGLQDRLASLFQLNQAMKDAKNPNYWSNAPSNAGYNPGPMSRDDLTYQSARVAEATNPNYNASIGYHNLLRAYPAIFSKAPSEASSYTPEPSMLSWGPQDYLGQLRNLALGIPTSGYPAPQNQRVVPTSRLQLQ